MKQIVPKLNTVPRDENCKSSKKLNIDVLNKYHYKNDLTYISYNKCCPTQEIALIKR